MNEPIGHVYMVEDDSEIRTHLTALLQRYGYSVSSYTSAEEFLERSVEVTPAVLLLDMHLPGLSGAQLQNRLNLARRGTPVVGHSQKADTSARPAENRCGASGSRSRAAASWGAALVVFGAMPMVRANTLVEPPGIGASAVVLDDPAGAQALVEHPDQQHEQREDQVRQPLHRQ